jgi:hypothetical protein
MATKKKVSKKSRAAKAVVVAKPTPKTVQKHVEILGKLAKKNKGKLPTYTWLNEHGYFRSYEVMRAVSGKFRHIKRDRVK